MSVQRVQLELDSNVRRLAYGTALLGGSPFRLVRLSAAGSGLLDRWLRGEPGSATSETDQLRDRLIRAGMVHPVVTDRLAHVPAAFVVPVYNDAAGLERLLRALRRDFADEPIVIVDDASRDGNSIATVADEYRADLVRHQMNRGPAAARNTGWQRIVHSPGECTIESGAVVFLDADVVPVAGAIRMMLAHFDDDGVAAVAPRVRAEPGLDLIAGYEADNSPLDMGVAPALVHPGTRVSYVPSAALAVRTDVLRGSGGFDADLRSGEDVDLIWRLVAGGQMVRYEPAAVVEHRNRVSLSDFARQRYFYGTSAAWLAERHGDKVSPLQLPGPVIATTLAALFGGRWLRLGAGLAAAINAVPLARKFEDKVDAPAAEAARLQALTHLYALQGLATAATRTWAPLLLPVGRLRRALGVAVAVPVMIDWLRNRPAIDPLAYLVMRAVDHGAYCAGVWTGAVQSRSPAALLPSVRFASSQTSQDD